MKLALFALLVGACASSPSGEVTSATITRTGGLTPTPPQGSTCTPIDERYAYDATARVLSWEICEGQGQGSTDPDVLVPGAAMLDARTADQLESAFAALHETTQECGGDLTDRITVVSTGGTRIYMAAQCLAGEQALMDLVHSASGR